MPHNLIEEVCGDFVDVPQPKSLKSVAPSQPAAPASAPAPVATQPTVNKHPWAQEDPNDDIPMEHPAPVAAPVAEAPKAASALAPDEQAELQALLARLDSNNPPLGVPELIRLNELRKRANA